jgi:hypothetical protein
VGAGEVAVLLWCWRRRSGRKEEYEKMEMEKMLWS